MRLMGKFLHRLSSTHRGDHRSSLPNRRTPARSQTPASVPGCLGKERIKEVIKEGSSKTLLGGGVAS